MLTAAAKRSLWRSSTISSNNQQASLFLSRYLRPRARSLFSSLQARLLLLILFIFVPVLILTWYTVAQQTQFASRKVQQEALRLAQLSASNQEQFITGAQQLLTALSQIPVVRAGNTPACSALFAQLHEQFTSYTNIFMVDSMGDTVCTGIPLTTPINVYERRWFQRAMQQRGFSIGDFELGAATRKPVVTLSYPILDGGQIAYVLGVSIDLNKAGDVIVGNNLPPNTTITTIDREGIVLYRYPEREDLIGKRHWSNTVIQAVLTQKSGTIEGIGVDGIERLFGFTPLDQVNESAFIIIGVAKTSAYADANLLLVQDLIGLGIVGSIALVTAFIGARRMVVQPMQHLVESTERLAAGDLTTRLDTRRVEHTNELQILAHTFNHMAQSLEQRQQDLQRSNIDLANEILERKNAEQKLQQARDGLEITVQERTAALVFLAEASKILASDLDYRNSLQRLAQLAATLLADFCTIDLVETDHQVQRIAAFPGVTEPEAAASSPQAVAWGQTPSAFSLEVIQSGEPQLISPAAYQTLPDSDGAVRHPRSLLCVPIKIQESVIGAITFGQWDSNRDYSRSDVELVEELSRQVAVAIHNARLYRQVYEHREHLLVTLASIGDGVIATDEKGCVSFMNTIAQALTGWSESEAINKHLSEVFQILHETSEQPVDNPALKAMEEGRIIGLSNHTILVSRNGLRRPIDDSGAPIWGEDRKILGSILVFRDITERRQRELAEREQRSLNEALRDTAMTLTSTLDLSEVLDRILANVGLVVPHDAADVMFIESGEARIVRSHGYSQWGMETINLTFPVNDTATLRQILETGQPVVIPDVREYPQWVSAPDSEWMRSYVGVPISLQSEIIGCLNLTSAAVDFFTPVQADHLQAFAAQAAIAIQNAQLFGQAQSLAVMEERQRLAYDLHDAVSQMLFSSSLLAESLPRLWKRSPDKVETQLHQLTRLNRGAHAELRNLLMELSPTNLLKSNMHDLLRQLALAISARKNLSINVQVKGQQNFPPDVHMTLYRIAQEGLNNVVKHARATQVDITLTTQQQQTVLVISDNGGGFDVGQTPPKSMGLTIMRDRARAIGGTLDIRSEIGQGTQIILTLNQA